MEQATSSQNALIKINNNSRCTGNRINNHTRNLFLFTNKRRGNKGRYTVDIYVCFFEARMHDTGVIGTVYIVYTRRNTRDVGDTK